MAIELVKKNYSQAKVTAMVIDAKPACMTGGKSLPAEENDRVVDILNKLLPKYKNQTGLARAIGVEQPTLSNILRRVTCFCVAIWRARTRLFVSTRQYARACCLRVDNYRTELALVEGDLAQRETG